MIRAIIFDCFGVIISDGLEAVLQRLKAVSPQAREYVGSVMNVSNRGLLEPAEANQQIAEYLGISIKQWREQIDAGEFKNTEVMDWIKQLRNSYKTAMLSNIGKGSMERRFNKNELTDLFDTVVISGEVGLVKPNPHIYRIAAEKLAVEPNECVFLDDRAAYCYAAHEVGMQAIVFKNLEQAQQDLISILAANPKN